ncbi:heterokaryon incompatibility protein-domain-containing protein [Lophiotrema nucula]|uniref:Heterokaryon incompatibility protein-domain-containing protein n=1 Tax=Lophiotrema nucula TaxID=690887 RepID=A0A6A5YUD3_9PLEO|nr:heterokaryon incompatibility protein-domain-containing protein [Lophiotrema nucula]
MPRFGSRFHTVSPPPPLGIIVSEAPRPKTEERTRPRHSKTVSSSPPPHPIPRRPARERRRRSSPGPYSHLESPDDEPVSPTLPDMQMPPVSKNAAVRPSLSDNPFQPNWSPQPPAPAPRDPYQKGRQSPPPPPSKARSDVPLTPSLPYQPQPMVARDRRSAPDTMYFLQSNEWAPPHQQQRPESKRYSEVPSPEVHYPVPGDFPDPSNTLRPEESRSEAGEIGMERLRPPSGMASVAATSFISQRLSSSGTLGVNGYQYTPLREREIRLVKLLRATLSTIKCEIHRASLDPPPEYIAISYTWGDADDTRPIVLVEEPPHPVDGKLSEYKGDSIECLIPVAASLHGALGALRRRDRDVYVWVDALCIDQQNRDERAQQVKLMTSIYKLATSVAIWLGPEEDESHLAMAMLNEIAKHQGSPEHIKGLIANEHKRQHFAAIVSLFERDYWKRLWIVQGVFNAREILVYCGERTVPWSVCKLASKAFWFHKNDFDRHFPRGLSLEAQKEYSLSQVLGYQGPNSIPDAGMIKSLGAHPLLQLMCICRRKLSADARDKVFGILGLLPEVVQRDFLVNYSLSVKEVYVRVVDSILCTTQRLDVICESIYYPPHTSSANLPTWCPDWSYITETTGIGHLVPFSASGSTTAKYKFLDEPRRRQLQIRAIYLDTVDAHGIAVGTLCTTADYLMAFLHWRAVLLDIGSEDGENASAQREKEDAFCRTLCFDHVPEAFNSGDRWLKATYHVFASLINERLPQLRLDRKLEDYLQENMGVAWEEHRSFLHQHFKRMMGRCFCLTENGYMGLGAGFMTARDIIVVPYGCSTPIILRPEGRHGEFRYVGDVYIHGFMDGEALKLDHRKTREREYILH